MKSKDGSIAGDRSLALFRLPPPIMFVVAFVFGATVHHFVPLPTRPLGGLGYLAGVVLLASGICMGASLAISFLLHRTTLNPFATPSRFVVRGPYRISRNPMYLTLVIAYLGGTLMLGSVWPLLTLFGPLWVLSRVVIPFEEALMLSAFGDNYRDYCSCVRRWL